MKYILPLLLCLAGPAFAQNHNADVLPHLDAIQDALDALRTLHTAPSLPPVANMDQCDTTVDVPVVCDPLANDTDPQGLALNLDSAVTPTAAGGAFVGGTYTPPAGYDGADSTTYTVCNTAALCSQGTIHFQVTAPPPTGVLALLAAHVPAPGQWSMVPNSSIAPVLTSAGEFTYCAQIECGASSNVLNAWNGAGFDPVNHQWYWAANGGHADYGGNEVYRYDFRTLTWRRDTLPSPLTGPEFAPGCPLPLTGPPAFHTYQGTIHVPGFVWVFGSVGYCQIGYTGPETHQAWRYQPSTMTWQHFPNLDSWGEFARAVKTPTDTIIVFRRNQMIEIAPDGTEIRNSGLPKYADYGSGTGVLHPNGKFYFGHSLGLLAVDAIPTFGNAITSPPAVVSAMPIHQASAVALHPPSGKLVFWDGNENVATYDPVTDIWESFVAPGPTSIFPNRVYSRFVYIAELDVFAGYPTNLGEGVWLRKL